MSTSAESGDSWWSPFACVSCTVGCEEEKRFIAGAPARYEFSAESQAPIPYAHDHVASTQNYSAAPGQPLLGVPIREGALWHLSTQDCFEPVSFSLYVNGIAFVTSGGLEASFSLSPFSLVRNCRFQAGECSKLKSFKVSLLEQDICCYFAVQSVCERAAEEERSAWVLGISHTILLVTNSLLPPVPITCDPMPVMLGAKRESRRLLAGYLIHRDDEESLSVIYCELNAHSDEARATLSIYEDHRCENLVMDIPITESVICCDVVGINCSCFVVDAHHFASQTPSGRKLWLRALSNVKVKVQNGAPPPDEEELQYYRLSIRETIRANEATVEPRISSTALLQPYEKKANGSQSNALHTFLGVQANASCADADGDASVEDDNNVDGSSDVAHDLMHLMQARVATRVSEGSVDDGSTLGLRVSL